MRNLIARIAQTILRWIDRFYLWRRKGTPAKYPYDKRTNRITLPRPAEKEIRDLLTQGNTAEAVGRVSELTGAGLVLSKQYIDALTAGPAAPSAKVKTRNKTEQRQRRRRR